MGYCTSMTNLGVVVVGYGEEGGILEGVGVKVVICGCSVSEPMCTSLSSSSSFSSTKAFSLPFRGQSLAQCGPPQKKHPSLGLLLARLSSSLPWPSNLLVPAWLFPLCHALGLSPPPLAWLPFKATYAFFPFEESPTLAYSINDSATAMASSMSFTPRR
ncbi:hypothetical protein RJ640_001913 [Escallonia rubra]|uniref:Uncharacterized protein n=1 Tax=Escallonia rubra TaxID=112253 RepID=A0AA88QR35_9ASTE|nr:hypothetical protein RJ640_001913 [Escallonia rubra]